MTAPLPVLRVEGSLATALTRSSLERLEGEQLTSFLQQRRWFGAKGRRPASARIADVVPIGSGKLRAAIARIEVVLGARVEHYQLPLTVRPDGGREQPRSVLALVEAGAERGILFDAVEEPAFRQAIGAAFERGASFGDADARVVIESVRGGGASAPAAPRIGTGMPSRVVAAEQSNTSIIYGEEAILKLFRRLEPGENPDVEIGRFLTTRTRFAHTPPLLGTLQYVSASPDGLHATAGMLQRFMPGSVDAWGWVIEHNRSYFSYPGQGVPAHPTAGELERLGRITRELHEALASDPAHPEFAPQVTSGADIAKWEAAARRSIDDAMALLADRLEDGAVPASRLSEARVLVRRREAFHEYVSDLMNALGDDAGAKIRHHGDYHLGQVLRTGDGGFMIIDFEGEPARPLAERRQRHSALRDVAGMLRSLSYAAATLAIEQRERAAPHVLELRAARWERESREAFLRGYSSGQPADFLPTPHTKMNALIALFEAEKVFYEMSYELNNRPDWVWIPMRGVSKLLVADAPQSAKPSGQQ